MEENIYQDHFVAKLFDRMSPSYEFMNSLTSLGFYPFWRQQAIEIISIGKGKKVTDLLTGPGESWKHILPRIGTEGELTALDFSTSMIQLAEKRKERYPEYNIKLHCENVFNSGIKDNSQDVVICCYGLKTFEHAQLEQLALEILRILKPGGSFSLVEVAMPETQWLKNCYRFYLGKVIPFLSKFLAENPETYNYLETYSNNFEGFDLMLAHLEKHGGNPSMHKRFFGCAKGITGVKS
ncbi:methyltransferase domain-containing protein [Robertkochia marina]|uniref:Methyltransferase domain-containing protein n=1 Tax=Robertkochia marina TaxID=1227945 RepID=A0A4S3M4G5_9FLAO|nr:class I SAM-dependent methyltransferase [Robertkochia marina]THD69705.1 methyltransferase domain-containing protein [Robertkochia marina]TRZ46951.1 methyltransferase domain-containing protein [Robertkochia marina]